MRFLLLALVSLSAFSLLACGQEEEAAPTASDTPADTGSPTATAVETPIATSSPSITPTPATLTYTDPRHGYSVEYPAGWILEEAPPFPSGVTFSEESVTIHSFPYCTDCPGEGALPPDGVKVDIFWIRNSDDLTLAEFVEMRGASDQVLSETQTSVAGRPAIRRVTRNSFGVEVVQVYLGAEGSFYQLAAGRGSGVDLAVVDSVLSTFAVAQ